MKYRILIKERKQKEIRAITPDLDNLLIAEVALDAAKCGYGSKFIHKYFTFIKIGEINDD